MPRTPLPAILLAILWLGLASAPSTHAQDEPLPKNRTKLNGLKPVPNDAWSRAHVERVLAVFANGGQPTEAQLDAWGSMKPGKAVKQMLTLKSVNLKLSPQGRGDASKSRCDSLQEMQDFWSSDKASNPMRVFNRPYHQTLSQDEEQPFATPLHLYITWSRAMHSPGCNTFLHKLALYFTNYHAAIHIENAATTLIRSYYDDTLAELSRSGDFVEVMNVAASHAALARAYGHMENRFDATRQFQGNDDFAREYFQLLFGIQGSFEDPAYHEDVTIEHNAWLLTGMALDAEVDAWGSASPNDWLLSPIVFGNHYDPAGRLLLNRTWHYRPDLEEASCLEILHSDICGRNAQEKLRALGPVAAAHPESMAATPLKIIRFFADDNIDPAEAAALQAAWADARYDLLAFLRSYARSREFHSATTVKFRNAFDRNLLIHNANQLTGEESYAEPFFEGPLVRMFEQGALVFAPVRDVFGGQTGGDAANDRYVFKQAWDANVLQPQVLGKAVDYYRLTPDGEVHEWRKDWSQVAPRDGNGQHTADQVGSWLWNRFVGDGGAYYDPVARAQVNAMLATGFDFGALADPSDPDHVWTASQLAAGDAAAMNAELAAAVLDLSSQEGNERVGMAINFITALPYTHAMGGVQ